MAKTWPPTWLTPIPEEEILAGKGDLAIEFIQAFGIITKDSIAGLAGTPLILRDWQKDLIRHLYAGDGQGNFSRQVNLVGLPRKSGKSAVGSSLAIFDLFFGPKGGEVYSCAAEKEQARIVFSSAKKMIEAHEELSTMTKLYRDAIEVPSTGSVYRVLSAEAYSKEGLNSSSVWLDEAHALPDRTLYDVMALSMGARGKKAHLVAITTAGRRSDSTGNDSIAYTLYQTGQRIANGEQKPSMFMAWWEAPKEADHRDPKTWELASPGYGDICSADDYATAVQLTPEAEFKTKRLNIWTNTKSAWLPAGAWQSIEEEFEPDPEAEYVLGFDGSWKNDSTALVAVQLPKDENDVYRAYKVAAWEKDFAIDDDSWIVDKKEVAKAVMDFFDTHPNCRELACDPTYWEDEMFQWADYGMPVVEYKNTLARTVPATAKLYEAVMNKKLRVMPDGALSRHIDNCILKIDGQRGGRITKDYRNPKLKIDLAIALMMAYDRASVRMEEALVPQVFV
jgi:phage terminase large subunit-like protein